ncbi:MAG: acyl carrier protein [Gammaproteobacteria bacterium]
MNTEALSAEALSERLRTMLVERFELDPAAVTSDARLFDDLGLDSIDAVDLALSIQDATGLDASPQEFMDARTVGDVERQIRRLTAAQ